MTVFELKLLRSYYIFAITAWRHQVAAFEGQDGLNQAKQLHPDLILMDLVMPVMDGFEATRKIRQDPVLQEIPIIATSASVFGFDQAGSQQAGCNGFVPKPIREPELLAQLQQCLSLNWIYELPEFPGANSSAGVTEGMIVPPPPAELEILLNLAMMGDIQGILEEAARLEDLNPQWIPFTVQLRELARGFKERQILEWIKRYYE